MSAEIDPEVCRQLADDLRANKLGGDLVQWIDRRFLPHDDDTADRVAREIRDDIDGGRCEPLDAFEGPASAIAAQLTAAAGMALELAQERERVETMKAEVWEANEDNFLCGQIAAEHGCLVANAPHDAVRTLANRYAEAQTDILRQAARIAALEHELATLQASVVDALSAAGPEVGEDERAP